MSAKATDQIENPYSFGLTIALRKLNSAARTRAEISSVLSAKGLDAEVTQSILDRLTDLGYLNDAEFAQAWVRSRVKSRGLAPSVLRRELLSKGVDLDIVDSALSTIDATDTDQRARELALKKYRALSGVANAVAMRRISSLLLRKGYSANASWNIAREVVGDSHSGGGDCADVNS